MFSHGNRIQKLEECCAEHRDRVMRMVQIDTELIAEMKAQRELFENHDKREMQKYEDIRKSISSLSGEIVKFNRVFWAGMGILMVLNFLGITDSIKALIREGITDNYKIPHEISKKIKHEEKLAKSIR